MARERVREGGAMVPGRELRWYVSLICLPAVLLLAGGVIALKEVRARLAVQEAAARESIVKGVESQALARMKGVGPERRAKELDALVDGSKCVTGAFLWERSNGIVRESGLVDPSWRLDFPQDVAWPSRGAHHAVASRGLWGNVAWVSVGRGVVAAMALDEEALHPGGAERFLLGVFVASALAIVVSVVLGGFFLSRHARRMRELSEMKSDFLDTVTHELKTPLAGIRFAIERLSSPALRPERAGVHRESVRRETLRLIRLVDQLLEVGRMEKRRRRYSIEAFDIEALVQETLQPMEGRFKANGIKVTFPKGGVPKALADRDAVKAALANVIDNAAKYASSFGEVTIEVSSSGGYLCIDVADRGPGMTESEMLSCFERLYRAPGAVESGVGGSGLGLDIARRSMREMGGDIKVRAREGGGCIFGIFIKEASDGEDSAG